MACGSQRTYVSQLLADQLDLKPTKVEELKTVVVSFGRSESRVVKTLNTLSLKQNNDELLTINANIVPVISGDYQRKQLTFP